MFRCRSLTARAELALAVGVMVALPVPTSLAQDPYPAGSEFHAPAVDDESDLLSELPTGPRPSGVAERLAEWATITDNNGDLPFLIVDKLGARIFAYDAAGDFLGSAPVLLGLARGDDSTPGVGALKLAQIGAEERTTPAGRFVAGFGDSDGHGRMLWVDLHDAISLHPVMSVSPNEHRFERIKSADPKQHRISYGCINVPKTFYDDVVLRALAGGNAIVYILPDTKPIDVVFPLFAAAAGIGRAGESPHQQARGDDPLFDALDHMPDVGP